MIAAKPRTFGLPMKCPSCPPRRYYGVLKGEQVPTHLVKYGTKTDVCDNCKTPLVPTIDRRTAYE